MLSRVAAWLFGQAYLLLILATFFWGGNMVAGRAAVGHVPPVTLATVRWIVAFLVVLPFAWPHLKRDWPVIRENFAFLCAVGATGIAAFNTLVYVGLEYTTAIKAALLQSTQPLLIGLWSFLLFAAILTGRQLVGIAISFVGVVGIITEWSPQALLGLDLNVGDLIVFAACVSYALYSTLLRRMPPIHWTSALAFTFAVGAIILCPFWFWEMAEGRYPVFDGTTIFVTLYVSLLPSIVSYLCYNRGVQLIGPNRTGPFLHLVPVFGTVFAIVILGEKLHLYHLASFALIFTGIAIAARGRPLSATVPAGTGRL
ncbi:DMT family transporter [Lutibaculum baratangense]|uniref:Permease of the drug/metabolite transporter (DMT) superfamily n=1 Tax=Lutibaculum baratangense AMV1 TaxID=631454 RepID=V4RVI9_9HYPH|nr:DMT family transporter [Lutibaculum baratangense]ESR27060.1 Permease of the drug/metabolite transporter (DMT) superfamily [Lutibaculum baratangense AMV1]